MKTARLLDKFKFFSTRKKNFFLFTGTTVFFFFRMQFFFFFRVQFPTFSDHLSQLELLEKKIKIYSFHDKIIISVAILNDVLDFYFVNHWCFVLQLHSQQHDSRNNRHDVLVDWSRKNNKKRKLSICMLFCCCSCLLNGQVCYLAFFPVGHTLNKLWHFYLFHFFFIYLFIFFFGGGLLLSTNYALF